MTSEEFYKKCLAYKCGHCHSKPKESCKDKRGYKTKPHSRRQDQLRMSYWKWKNRKTARCPTCEGTGRVKVVGPDATHYPPSA